MTYNEALVIVTELNRGRKSAPYSVEEKALIERIYPDIMGRRFRRTSCRRCYHDAVIEMAVKLRKSKEMERIEKCDYRMRAGFIIHNPAIDGGKVYTNANLTNEVAEKYLALYPQKAVMFEKIPAKVEQPAKPAETPANDEKPAEQVSNQPSEKTSKNGGSKRKKGKK